MSLGAGTAVRTTVSTWGDAVEDVGLLGLLKPLRSDSVGLNPTILGQIPRKLRLIKS